MKLMLKGLLLLLTGCFLFISCKEKQVQKTMFERMENTGIRFSNNIQNTKDFNIFSYRNFYNGGGVAIGDINNDGMADVFFTSNMGSNSLYLNKGNWKFEDITAKSGLVSTGKWGTGVVLVDINADGWLDIYVCNAGYLNGVPPHNELYINNHNLTFTEAAASYGLTNQGGYATHAAFMDYDLDNDLDVFIINNSFIPVNTLNYANKRDLRAKDWPVADFLKGGGDRFLRNDNGKFTDVSEQAGIHGSLISFGLGVTVGDINGDHYPDVYVSNDFFERDYLYINQKNGAFKDDLEASMQHVSHSSMGADIGDINNDGFPDIFTTDMLPYDDYRLKTTTSFESVDVNRLKVNSGFYNQYMQNTLQVNNGNGKFLETAYYSGVAASDWSWGGLIFDADNDGLSDIYICNGIYNDVTDQDFIDFFANDVIQKMVMTGKKDEIEEVIKKMPSQPILNKAYKNKGKLKFSDEGPGWGFTEPSFSNGAAYGDLDNDGDLDLVVNNVNQESFIYRNNSREITKNNFIALTLEGKENNRFAIGTNVKVYQRNNTISRELIPSRGFQSSVDYKLTIGVGNEAVDSIIITWPDTSITKLVKPDINKLHHVVQTGSHFLQRDVVKTADPFFMQLPSSFQKHEEDDFIDFYNERGVPMMLSREGPKATYGDVNGDGLSDIYICGAANQAGQLYLQTADGFRLKNEDVFRHLASFEDVCAVFFDCDNDKDMDLFVGSGGNHREVNNLSYQNRLYKNDGKGNFQAAINAFPNTGMNTSVAVANDFDHDGDVDLFVGSRSIPLNYGLIPENFLFINDGTGSFGDIAKEKAPALAGAGMVTTAVATDVDNDGLNELVLAGDWMAPRIFSFKNNAVTEMKTNLGNLHGWWKTVISADLDGDGDQDLLLGNVGENFYLQPDASSPVKMFISDFDQNGTVEKIITRSINGKDMPVFLKKELTDQIVSLRKQNLKYAEFANKSIRELFPPEILKNAEVRNFNYSSSCLAMNEGQGNFRVSKLPEMVQLSSVNAALASDVNEDGTPDLILAGNQFDFLPQFSRLDASYGHLLLNNGKGIFTWIAPAISGLDIRNQVRDMIEIQRKKDRTILMLQNNDYPVLYRLNSKKR